VITLDHEGRVVEFNRAAEDAFGVTSGEVLGRDCVELAIPERFRESGTKTAGSARRSSSCSASRPRSGSHRGSSSRLHPNDRRRVLAEVECAHRLGEPFDAEYRLLAKDGRVVWVLDETIAVRDDEYRPLFVQGFLIDVTERHAAEEALEQSERLYRLVVENATDAIALLDLDGRVVFASPATERLTGATRADLEGRRFTEFLHPDDLERGAAVLAQALTTAAPLPTASRMRHEHGTWVAVEGVVSAIHDESGEPAGLLAMVRASAREPVGLGADEAAV
jgi:PAS domain S-box-containing protein